MALCPDILLWIGAGKKKRLIPGLSGINLTREPLARLELATYALRMRCSTN